MFKQITRRLYKELTFINAVIYVSIILLIIGYTRTELWAILMKLLGWGLLMTMLSIYAILALCTVIKLRGGAR